MVKTPVAIRIDVDSARDIALLPELLDLLTRYGIKGTFFITTGPDRLALNFFKHLAHPRSYAQFVKSRPLSRQRFCKEPKKMDTNWDYTGTITSRGLANCQQWMRYPSNS